MCHKQITIVSLDHDIKSNLQELKKRVCNVNLTHGLQIITGFTSALQAWSSPQLQGPHNLIAT